MAYPSAHLDPSRPLPADWPTAHTTSTSASIIRSNPAAFNLISAILTTFELDEISNADDGDGIWRYIMNQGMVRGGKVVKRGVTFWVYPTGGKGPYEELDESSILLHGLLVTVEQGALLSGMVDAIMRDLPRDGIGHIHFPRQVADEDSDSGSSGFREGSDELVNSDDT